MEIYAEYLFLENAVTGGLILLLTGKIAGVTCKKGVLLIGSTLCGLYSFILFWDSPYPVAALLSKLFFSVILIFVVFRPGKVRRLARITLIFYLISFAMGGITIGSMYFFGVKGISNNNSIYLGSFGYVYILLGCVLTGFFFSMLSNFITSRMIKERTFADVEITLKGKAVTIKGMVDTGNFLKDPLTGKPVMIISADAAKKFLPLEIVEEAVKNGKMRDIPEKLKNTGYVGRIRLIPFHSIGEEEGCLIGIRIDKIRILLHKNKGEVSAVTSEGAILAIYKGKFSFGQFDEDCSILLHASLLKGGIAGNV
ncbi:MAG: sigma-E processing peptidase SpoIIGA [Eubacteriales bacterium]|nr:sigma-E processing peptidase SpoIIGA [Eubacteriales bacterium]MDD4629720.1 sigma-E processing peptidase SpoIIGA [Eubacteriales bacterium]